MRWRYLTVAFLCLLMFAFGFNLGGIRWSWTDGAHTNEIAFWSMLGGWVSGLATLAAVVVSMWMAYHSSQVDVEKISISLSGVDRDIFGDSYIMNIRIQNLKNIHVEITDLKVVLDDLRIVFSLNGMFPISLIQNKCMLERKGEYVDFPLSIDAGHDWWAIFSKLDKVQNVMFKKAKLQVYTPLKTYEVKIPPALLPCMKERFEAWRKNSNRS